MSERAEAGEPPNVPRQAVAPCFTSDLDAPDVLTHLRPARYGAAETLCGKKAMPPLPGRRKVTCGECKRLKPKVLGGS